MNNAEQNNTKVETNTQNKQEEQGMRRRDFLGLGLITGFLGKMGLDQAVEAIRQQRDADAVVRASRRKTLEAHIAVPPNTQLVPAGELLPAPDGAYSPFILEHNLQPRVLEANATPVEKTLAGVDYLRRLRDALKDKPELHGPILAQFNPQLLSMTAFDTSWTIFNALDDFVTKFDQGIIKILPPPNDDTDADYFMRTRSFARRENGRWIIAQTEIYAGDEQRIKTTSLQAGENIYVKNHIDVTTALTVFHEYLHRLQESALLEFLNNNPDIWPNYNGESLFDPRNNAFASAMSQLNRVRLLHNLSHKPADSVSEAIINRVVTLELQVETYVQYLLDRLIRLNTTPANQNNPHMPGTNSRDWIYPSNAIEGAIDNRPLFEEAVLATGNALDIRWILGFTGIRSTKQIVSPNRTDR